MEVITEYNNLFKTFCMKNPDYVMSIMVSWITLDKLEVTRKRRDFIDSSGTKETKQYTYSNTSGIHFRYIIQVDKQNNWRHVPIY